MKWNIVADSSCDLKNVEINNDLNLSVVPMKLTIGNDQYIDNGNLDVNNFMAKMKEFKGSSGSACPAPGEFLEEFEKADNVLCVCLTSSLSGTYNSAVQARELALDSCPDKNIFILDTKATSGKMQLVIERAIELISDGLSFEEIKTKITEYNNSIRLLFSLSSFDNLIKNGRMPLIKGMLATVMGIHPIATASDEGTIEVIDKPRGAKNAIIKLFEHIKDSKPLENLTVIISHCNNNEGASTLKSMITEYCNSCKVKIVSTGGLCSFYADMQGIIVAF